jgi:hypothetical protein
MRFADVEGLRTWLESTEEGYGEYAARLWASGGNNVRQLANGSVEDLMDAGITNRLHAIDIKLVAGDNAVLTAWTIPLMLCIHGAVSSLPCPPSKL